MKWLFVLAVIGCKQTEPIQPGECLRLPGAVRSELIADPQGDGLFWLQPDENDGPFFEVVSGGEPLAVRDAKSEAGLQEVLEIAGAVYDETKLALESHVVKDAFTVNVRTTMDFETETEDARMTAVTNAYRRYDRLRGLYDIDPKQPLRLHVDVIDDAYEFDGAKLTRL